MTILTGLFGKAWPKAVAENSAPGEHGVNLVQQHDDFLWTIQDTWRSRPAQKGSRNFFLSILLVLNMRGSAGMNSTLLGFL